MNYKSLFGCVNRVAVVTGGAGLIGREIVRGLCDFGAKVYIADTDKKAAQRLLSSKKIKFIYLDITSEESIEGSLIKVHKDNRRLDILVNCAYPRTNDWGLKLGQVPFSSWKDNLNNQLGGYFLCCRKAAELMKQHKRGSIINLASTYGLVAPDFKIYKGTEMTMPVAYSAIKGGLIALTRYFAAYYAGYNIRANIVSPGGIFNNQHPSFVKKYNERTPLGRMGDAKDIAGAVIYLASDAASYVTGSNLVVDGGWTIW